MKSKSEIKPSEPGDGDWCLVDLSEAIVQEATTFAHAMGLSFHDFMCLALEEKLADLRDDESSRAAVKSVRWDPTLK